MKEGWETRMLGDVLHKTETIDPTKTPENQFIYVDVSSVNNTTFMIENTTLLFGKEAPSRARKLVRTGDIIFATVRPTLKRLAVIPTELNEQVCSTGYFVLRGKDFIENKYLFYYLQTDAFYKSMEKLQKGASYPAVTDGEVRGQLISYPKSLTEQQRIVSILDEAFAAIDKAKANIERNLQNAKELFQSELNVVFLTKGEGWIEQTLSEISLQFGRGKSKHRPRNDEKLYGGDYPFIQTGDVRNSSKTILSYSQTYNEAGLKQSKLWPKGTICITIAANIAETGILNFDSCFPDSMVGLIVDPKKADVDFTYYALQFLKAKLQLLGKGSAQDNINLGTFESQTFPFPSIKEQKRLVLEVNILSARTKKLESLYQQKLVVLEGLKKSILQKAFSGELKEKEVVL